MNTSTHFSSAVYLFDEWIRLLQKVSLCLALPIYDINSSLLIGLKLLSIALKYNFKISDGTDVPRLHHESTVEFGHGSA